MKTDYFFSKGRFKAPFKSNETMVKNEPSSNGFISSSSAWLGLFFLTLSLLVSQNGFTQVSAYTFTESIGTYTPITGGTVVATATGAGMGAPSLDDTIYNLPTGTIPFSFTFDGIPYTGLNISTNGFITFGIIPPVGTSYTPLSATLAYAGAVSVFGGDNNSLFNILGNTGEIRYQTVGSAPNQEFVIQWSNFRPYSTSTSTTLFWRWNYQIRLHQNGTINMDYNANFVGAVTATSRQVGLRGPNNTFATNVRNRLITTGTNTWNSSVNGTTNTSTCAASTTNVPVSGKRFTFTPPVVASPPNCATGFAPANAATNVQRNATLSWTAATGFPTSYDVYFGTATNPPLVGNQPGTSYTPALLAANTQYFWRIVPKNANGDAVGCTEQSFTTGTSIVYCAPTYASGCSGDNLDSITLNTLSDSGMTCVPVVEDRSGVQNAIPNLQQGATETATLTLGTDTSQFNAIWVDFNQNGVFDATEYFTLGTNAGVSGVQAIPIAVPPGATLGNTKMRVRAGADTTQPTAGQACGALSSAWGSSRDYTVNIIAQPTDTPDYVNLQFPATATVLAGNSETVYAQVYEAGLTDVEPGFSGQAAGIEAWIGISPVGSNSNPNTWTTWIPATHNAGAVGNNDEYQANIGSTLAPGTYYYASRFRLNGGPFVYGGNPFNAWDGTSSVSGVLTVDPNPTQCATLDSPANGATNIPIGTLALSWTAPTSGPAPTGYKVFSGTTSGSLTLLTTTTNLTLNVNVPAYSTTYYWQVVPTSVIGGGDAVGCAEFSFTTQADPFAPYCSGITFTSAVEPISSVDFAGITNTSPAALNGGPAHENFISITGAVTVGSSYPMVLKGNTDGGFTNNFRVFIDWNQDGDFADAGESYNAGSVANSTGIDAVTAVSTIAVPATALAGTTRMRIKKLWSGDSGIITNPCTGGGYGQTEDYSLIVSLTWYEDADSDGFGNPASSIAAVTNPGGYVLDNTDCDDTQTFYTDSDGDGFGVLPKLACGTVTNDTDCNDNQIQFADVDGDGFGSTTQVACGVINSSDCNDNQIQFADVDGDGFGSTTQVACGVGNSTDCNDNQIQYADADGDGYGTAVQVACGVALTGDCNDANPAVRPNATEVCYDGIDNNCDGTIDEGCTPIISTIQATQCGITLPLINSNIFANLVAGAQGYRFTVTDMTTNQVQTIDRALRVFNLTQLSNYAFDRTYQVQVSIRFNNVWQPFFGAPCMVTTPATVTQIQAAQCDGTLTTMGDVIFANNVPFATGYRFRITNLLTSVSVVEDRLLRDIRLTNIAGFTPEFNTTYSVEVAIRNTNGLYLQYNPVVCNITTPSFPTTQLQLSQCDVTISNPNTTIFADSYAGATTYRFKFTSGAFSYITDRPLRSFILSSIPLPGAGAYSVQVSIEINGVFGGYGKICTLTIPGGERGNEAAGNNFQAIASPNPFASTFGLNLSTTSEEQIQVRVYDMLGKLVEDRKAQASDIIELGDNYPSGVYNVIVSQGTETKTLRVIKR